MRELYIYYRVRASDALAATQAVRDMHARLCIAHPALVARVLRRPDESDGRQTWMETYSTTHVNDDVTPEIQADIESLALALAALIDGPRHTEVFIACAS